MEKKEKGYVIVDKFKNVFEFTFSHTAKDAKLKWLNNFEEQEWKDHYKIGYRCKKCEITIKIL